MSRSKTLSFDIDTFTYTGREILTRGWCINEDENQLWLSQAQWYDTTHSDICNEEGLEDVDENRRDDLWFQFLNSLQLDAGTWTELENLWAENPENEARWN